MGISIKTPSAPGVTRYRNESDSSYFARVAAANAAAKAAAVKQAQAAAAAAAVSKQKLDALIASKYPQGLPSWVAANGLTPVLGYQPNTLLFLKNESDGKTYYTEKGEFIKHYSDKSQGLDPFAILGGVALSFLLPGVGSAIAGSLLDAGIVTSELAANVIGNAIANTAASVAQGQTLDKALTNAVVGVAVNTGSLEAAKELNTLFKHPAVTDAIVSAAGSAVKTAAAGGTEQDIINNMTGALAGSAASSAYQKGGEDYTRETGRVIGSAVAGAVTGGTTGAITGAVGELGGQSKGKVAGAIEDVISPQDTGALPASQVAAMTPDTDAGAALPTVEVTAQRPADIIGTNIISPAAVTTAPAALEPVTVTGKKPADITDTDVINAIAAEKTPDAVLPTVTVTGKKEEPPVLEPVTVTATRPADITSTDIIDEPAKLEDVTVTGKKEEPLLDVAVEEPPPEEKPPEEKPYKPDLFILGGKKPKAPPSKTPTSVLSQALGTTTGLTASRGAGEIEDPSTGKKKRKVWNEETLRLKDALGV